MSSHAISQTRYSETYFCTPARYEIRSRPMTTLSRGELGDTCSVCHDADLLFLEVDSFQLFRVYRSLTDSAENRWFGPRMSAVTRYENPVLEQVLSIRQGVVGGRNVRFHEYGAYALLTASRRRSCRMIAERRQPPGGAASEFLDCMSEHRSMRMHIQT